MSPLSWSNNVNGKLEFGHRRGALLQQPKKLSVTSWETILIKEIMLQVKEALHQFYTCKLVYLSHGVYSCEEEKNSCIMSSVALKGTFSNLMKWPRWCHQLPQIRLHIFNRNPVLQIWVVQFERNKHLPDGKGPTKGLIVFQAWTILWDKSQDIQACGAWISIILF